MFFGKIKNFSVGESFRDNWGPERGSDSLKVTQQARTRDELQARDLSTNSWRTRPFKGGEGICPQESSHRLGGSRSLTIMPSFSLSSLPHSLQRDGLPGTLLTTRAAVRAVASLGLGQNRRYRERRSHRGRGQLSPTPTGSEADRRKGRRRTRLGELTPQRIPSAPQPPPKRKTGLGGGGPGGEPRMRLGSPAPLWEGRPANWAGSPSPSPEVKGLPGGTLQWGRGRRERGPRTTLECLIPERTRRGEVVYRGCTYSCCRRCCHHLHCFRHRLKKPHPSACSRGDSAWEGLWAGASSLLLLLVSPSFLLLHQPSALPSASALLLGLQPPANRAAACWAWAPPSPWRPANIPVLQPWPLTPGVGVQGLQKQARKGVVDHFSAGSHHAHFSGRESQAAEPRIVSSGAKPKSIPVGRAGNPCRAISCCIWIQ